MPPFHLILCYALKVVFADVIDCEALKLPSSTLKLTMEGGKSFVITITLCNMYFNKLDNGWKGQHIE